MSLNISIFCSILPLLVITIIFTVTFASNISKSEPCSRTLKEPPASQCLARFRSHPEDYAHCKSKICFIFIQEPPFVILPESLFSNSDADVEIQKPFRCGMYEDKFPRLRGIAFDFHNATSASDASCMWGGHSGLPSNCTFNSLVAFTEYYAFQGYKFAISGLLLETSERLCHHNFSASLIDDRVIIIGRSEQESIRPHRVFYQLTRPFHWGTWIIFVGIFILFLFVCGTIAVQLHRLRWRSIVTAFYIFAGAREEALARKSISGKCNRDENQGVRVMTFATKYGLAMALYRIAVLASLGIFLLFYEVAVVNFVFQEQVVKLSRSVTELSREDLERYAVLRNSALEDVWSRTVNLKEAKNDGTDETIPWHRCATVTECFDWALDNDHPVDYIVSFEAVGKYMMLQKSTCDDLMIFETDDKLYEFNGGWLYNNQVDTAERTRIDRELTGLRINGTARRFIEREIGDFSCERRVSTDIGPMLIAVPCLFFVVPPLIGSLLVLLLWKQRTKRKAETKSREIVSVDDETTLEDGDTDET